MKKIFKILLIFTITTNLFSQHSDKFLDLTKNLKSTDSIISIKKFKNGQIKEKSKYLIYEYEDSNFEILSGKFQLFDKNGRLFFEQEYDRFGNLLYQRQINENNQVHRLIKTTKIDLKASITIENLLKSDKNILIETLEKDYSTIEKGGEMILWKEGKD